MYLWIYAKTVWIHLRWVKINCLQTGMEPRNGHGKAAGFVFFPIKVVPDSDKFTLLNFVGVDFTNSLFELVITGAHD